MDDNKFIAAYAFMDAFMQTMVEQVGIEQTEQLLEAKLAELRLVSEKTEKEAA